MFNISACQSLLTLEEKFGNEWYPVTVGFVIDRAIFETLINARYISIDPLNRSKQYIDYGKVISKKNIDAIYRHCNTSNLNWKEIINYIISNEYKTERVNLINDEYNKIKSSYEHIKNGKKIKYSNWSGKSIRDMACDVNHEIEYDLFYRDLSSYTHANVKLADQFLNKNEQGFYWTLKPEKFQLFSVFRYATTFFMCFLELFGGEFNLWSVQEIRDIYDRVGTNIE